MNRFEGTTDVTRRVMQANKGKDTKPELIVRRFLHRMGYRYRLHHKDLPGKPDMTFPARMAVVEVRGCFWHGHNCKIAKLPKSREGYTLSPKRWYSTCSPTRASPSYSRIGA